MSPVRNRDQTQESTSYYGTEKERGNMLQRAPLPRPKSCGNAFEDAASIEGLLITTEAMDAQNSDRPGGISNLAATDGMMQAEFVGRHGHFDFA